MKSNAQVAIVGSGLMGRGIGLAFALGHYDVQLVDVSTQILTISLGVINTMLGSMKTMGLVSESEEVVLSRIRIETDLKKAASSSDYVVEAVSENLDLKRDLFRKLDDAAANHNCILASNTSSLPISSIASTAMHPERIVGTHFWNPPHLMPAVEIVYGEKTSDETVNKSLDILRRIGKRPAIVRKDIPGQIGIRILYAMIREATHLVEAGVATPDDIDTVVKEALGTRLEVVGPLELADLSGVDLVNNVAKGLYKSLDNSTEPQNLVKEMIQQGRIGIKSGRGFYDWNEGSKSAQAVSRLRDEHLVRILKERKKSSLDSVN